MTPTKTTKGDAGHTPRAVIYTRFSPRRNAAECESCAWQQAECEQYAHRKGYAVARAYADPDVSGADTMRPTLWECINSLRKGEILLVWKWDRLARDLLLQLQIERAVQHNGATVEAMVGDIPGTDPQAQFMRQILGAVAELERKMIRQRTSAAMRALQRGGKRMSKLPPYGWKIDPENADHLIENPDEQTVLADILARFSRGEGYRPIARALNEQGLRMRCGSPWDHVSVRRICSKRSS